MFNFNTCRLFKKKTYLDIRLRIRKIKLEYYTL